MGSAQRSAPAYPGGQSPPYKSSAQPHTANSVAPLDRILKRHVPVGVAQEARPACDACPAGVVQGFPGGAHRSAPKLHAGLVGRSVGLPRVARNAGERTVFPGGLSSLSPWNHVVDRQFLGAGLASAILAGRVISFEQVAAAESHGLVPRPIVTGQGQNFGNAEMEPHGSDEGFTLARSELRPVRPAIELKVVGIDDMSRLVPQHDQAHGAQGRRALAASGGSTRESVVAAHSYS